jgi:hypothetical protein
MLFDEDLRRDVIDRTTRRTPGGTSASTRLVAGQELLLKYDLQTGLGESFGEKFRTSRRRAV